MGPSRTLLLLGLLPPLHLCPYQTSRLAQNVDRVALTWVVELHQILNSPDTGKGTSQTLGGALLLLLLLLIAFRHPVLLLCRALFGFPPEGSITPNIDATVRTIVCGN